MTWALDPKSGAHLPSSTRTVKALMEVEAFALEAEELKYVAGQFRRLHSRQVQHTFRFYSQQWRTWAACFIQATWRRCSRRKIAEQRRREEEEEEEDNYDDGDDGGDDGSSNNLGAALYVTRFASQALQGIQRHRNQTARDIVMQKPPEPNFETDNED